MNKLTKKKAQELIRRELGVPATALEKPSEMNNDPAWPYFELYSGTLRISVCSKTSGKVNYVILCVAHRNSDYSVSEYFYGDTLEFAVEATELHAAEDFYEKASGYVADDTVFDPLLRRAGKAVQEANRQHFGR